MQYHSCPKHVTDELKELFRILDDSGHQLCFMIWIRIPSYARLVTQQTDELASICFLYVVEWLIANLCAVVGSTK